VALDPGAITHLRLVPGTGELEELDECPSCKEYERDVRRKNAQITQLKRDREAKAKQSEIWPVAHALFDYWRDRCGHKRTQWNLDRFEQAAPFIERHGEDMCRLAIEGAAFDCFTTERKNGTIKRHDDWGLIFRPGDPDKFDEFVRKAPRPHPRDPDPMKLIEAQAGIAAYLREEADRIDEASEPREVAVAMQRIVRSMKEHGLHARAAFIAREQETQRAIDEADAKAALDAY
jgi:hypothetical protein